MTRSQMRQRLRVSITYAVFFCSQRPSSFAQPKYKKKNMHTIFPIIHWRVIFFEGNF